MATTLLPPEPPAADERAPRMLAITANLLPPEIVDSRRARKVRRIVLSALAAFVVALGGWYTLTSYQTSVARAELADAQGDVERLSQQQKRFTNLVKTQNESRAIGTQLSTLLANDVRWSRLLSSLQGALPQDVQVGSVTGALTSAANATAGSADSRLPNTSPHKLIGTVTVTGTAASKASVAAYLDALAKASGLANPSLANVTEQDQAYEFTLRLDVTASALSGRYPAESRNDTGGK
jgi:Tfp pilus assembly protein PilN